MLFCMLTGPSTVPQSYSPALSSCTTHQLRASGVELGCQGSSMLVLVDCPCLTCYACCCSMSRLGGSNGASNAQASSLGSNTSMESAKTAAAAQREPQLMADDSEQAREAAALVEWIHEQVKSFSCLAIGSIVSANADTLPRAHGLA